MDFCSNITILSKVQSEQKAISFKVLTEHCLHNPNNLICEKVQILGRILSEKDKFHMLARQMEGCRSPKCVYNDFTFYNDKCIKVVEAIKERSGFWLWNPHDLPERQFKDYFYCLSKYDHIKHIVQHLRDQILIENVEEIKYRHPISDVNYIRYWTFDKVHLPNADQDSENPENEAVVDVLPFANNLWYHFTSTKTIVPKKEVQAVHDNNVLAYQEVDYNGHDLQDVIDEHARPEAEFQSWLNENFDGQLESYMKRRMSARIEYDYTDSLNETQNSQTYNSNSDSQNTGGNESTFQL